MVRAAERLDDNVVCLFGDTVVRRDNHVDTNLFEEQAFDTPESLTVFRDALPTQFPYMFSLLDSSLIRREALMKTGAFLEGLRTSEDFLANFRLALHHSFAAIPDVVTRIYRTEDLKQSSLDRGQNQTVDYHRARMLAFSEAWAVRGDGSWRGHYRHVAIRLTQMQIKDGSNAIGAALDQFRYGVTPRALAWALAAVASPLWPRRRPTPRRTSEIA